MSRPLDELHRLVVATVRDLPDALVETCATGLEAAPDWTRAGVPVVQLYDRHAARWHALWRAASACPGCTPGQLAGLLRGAADMEAEWRRSFALEVAWTGPTPPLSTLRRTEQALLEVVDSAQRDLWLVSFATYRLASVCDALVAAAQRGARVRLLLESEAESDGRLASGGIDDMPDAVRQCCELYVWPRERRTADERGRVGLLHAKCAVADGEVLFVGSANLTGFAFELNIELGVLVKQREIASAVEQQLRWLVSSGTMQRLGA